MTIESDTLAVLQKLEKHLAASSRSTGIGGGRSEATADRAQAGTDRENRKKIQITVGRIEHLGNTAQGSASQLQGLTKSAKFATGGLGDLTGELGRTITQFTNTRSELSKINMTGQMTALQDAVESAASSIRSTSIGSAGTEIVTSVRNLGTAFDLRLFPAIERFDRLIREANRTMEHGRAEARDELSKPLGVVGVIRKLKSLEAAIGGATGTTGVILQITRATRFLREFNKTLISSIRDGGSRRGGGGGGRGGGGGDEDDTPSSDPKKAKGGFWNKLGSTLIGGAIVGIFKNASAMLAQNLVKVLDEMYQVTAARGFGTTDAFVELSVDAIKAGMSLQEYAKMLEENMGAVSRFSSFKAFDEQLDVGRDSLKKFGIFGLEATNLSAAMIQSSQSLGVPISNTSSAMTGQIKVFEQLRRTTGITAEAFTDLVKVMRDDEAVQNELLGLRPAERATRFAQISQTRAWGVALGLTEQASSKLTEALMAQRKSTVKERFEARGRLRQAFALAGMSNEDTQRVAELQSIRQRTPEQDKEYIRLIGEYKSRSEEAKQFGGEGMQYQFETMDEKLGATLAGKASEASVAVRLAEQSGAQLKANGESINANLNKQLNAAEQAIGVGLATIEGISKSNALLSGIAVAVLGGNWILAKILAKGMMPGGIDMPDTPGGGGKGKGARGKNRLKAGGLVGAAIGSAVAIEELYNADETAKETGRDKKEIQGEAIGGGLGIAGGASLGTWIGGALGTALAPGIGTAIGMALGGAAGGWLGDKFGTEAGGFIGSLFGGKKEEAKEEATIKASKATEENTKETKKNSDELKKIGAILPTDEISASNLRALAANVSATGKALYGTQSIQPGTQIATPTPQTQTAVNPGTVNKPEPETAAEQSKTSTLAPSTASPTVQDPATILAQILGVLNQSLVAENAQVDLTSQLVKSQSGAGRLVDKQVYNGRVIAQ